MNCSFCDHPLIDHGYQDDNPSCKCCTGGMWETVTNKLPRGFVVCEEFPDYMINSQGQIKQIESGKFALFLRLTKNGDALVRMYKEDRKVYARSVQKLRDKAFPDGHTKLGETDGWGNDPNPTT